MCFLSWKCMMLLINSVDNNDKQKFGGKILNQDEIFFSFFLSLPLCLLFSIRQFLTLFLTNYNISPKEFLLMINLLNHICFSCVCIFEVSVGFLHVSLGKVWLCNFIWVHKLQALEIKSILGRKSAILEKGNRTKTDIMFENCYHTLNHPPKPFWT